MILEAPGADLCDCVDIQIGASVLAADPVRLADEIETVRSADFLHVDVFDDRFVRGVSWGQGTLERIVEVSDLPVEVHLMVESPREWAEMAVAAGCARVIFHVEAALISLAEAEGAGSREVDVVPASGAVSGAESARGPVSGVETAGGPVDLARLVKRQGIEVAVAISPGTPLGALDACLPIVDSVLVMTVEPGKGGSKMLEGAPLRVSALRERTEELGFPVEIEVDGGVKLQTGRALVEAGATRFVVGTGLFEADDRSARIADLRTAFGGCSHAGC